MSRKDKLMLANLFKTEPLLIRTVSDASLREDIRNYIKARLERITPTETDHLFNRITDDVQLLIAPIADLYRRGRNGDGNYNNFFSYQSALIDEIFTALCGEDFMTIILKASKKEPPEPEIKHSLEKIYDKYNNVWNQKEKDFTDRIFELICGQEFIDLIAGLYYADYAENFPE